MKNLVREGGAPDRRDLTGENWSLAKGLHVSYHNRDLSDIIIGIAST